MKTIKAQLLPDELQGPGFGWLHLEPLELGSEDSLSFTIERNQDGRFLGGDAQWQPTSQWLSPLSTDAHGNRVACHLDAQVIDALLANPQMQYRLVVRTADQQAQAVLRLAAGLYPSNARAAAAAPVEPTPEPEPVPEPAPPPAPEPEPPAKPPAAKRSKVPLLVALVALAVAGGALWWWLQDRAEVPEAPAVAVVDEPAPEQQAEPEPEPEPVAAQTEPEDTGPEDTGPCALDGLDQLPDPLGYLQTCVQSDPSTEQILQVIEAGKAANQCDLIQRLYAHAAQAGHAPVALAYAQEFDPQTFTGGCFNVADAETAVYWYELYLRQQPNDATALERLDALKRSP